MSEDTPVQPSETATPPLPKVDPESLVLRARPQRAVRFKRGVIVSLAAAAATGVVATAWFALEPHALRLATNDDDRSLIAKAPTDTLSALPTSYGAAPKLGPPLPGDLGRPILDRQRQLGGQPMPPVAGPGRAVDDARQRKADDLKAARQSGLLVQTSDRGLTADAGPPIAPSANAPASDVAPKVTLDPDRDPNGQQRKTEFTQSTDKAGDTNPYRLAASPSPFTLAAGSVIAGSLITGLRSDLPGLVTAQVTERVYDSATGRILLIPQGARLIGSYDSVVAFGQRRALVVWQRILMPDGSSLRLDNAPATDPSGYAGLEDKVDAHTWALLKGVVLSTLLGVGAELQFSGQSDLVQALRQSTQQSVSRAGDQLTSRNLQVQPTITIRPGAPVRLVLHRDLILKPWQER
ncbi:TrbI/VirB10 family protein [Sphingomonas sp.]|jgi:type IV secretion system protein VirB10|uniref:TrbI/VirB10 family protein n=1 Tax=Sphingomonas sp. TaxID=28214 RepID=UPI002E3170EC|nr:TrbI/VirB10 family protein [Sphingomonas sp.]HEX4693645.1 TrbI/VirB10 family protein [Sphingomonas sp.]